MFFSKCMFQQEMTSQSNNQVDVHRTTSVNGDVEAAAVAESGSTSALPIQSSPGATSIGSTLVPSSSLSMAPSTPSRSVSTSMIATPTSSGTDISLYQPTPTHTRPGNDCDFVSKLIFMCVMYFID